MPAKSHGGSHTRLYQVWSKMRQRCSNPKDKDYCNYGGRGIKVCERWNSFTLFSEDMGKKPSPDHTVERVNNDGDYEPSNVIWATRTEQNNNKRKATCKGCKVKDAEITRLREILALHTIYAEYSKS